MPWCVTAAVSPKVSAYGLISAIHVFCGCVRREQELDNLVRIGTLKAETASRKEFEGMLASARRGLVDAQNQSIETDSQFDLAYGAAQRLWGACPGHDSR